MVGFLIWAGAYQYLGAVEWRLHIEIMTAIKCHVSGLQPGAWGNPFSHVNLVSGIFIYIFLSLKHPR